MANESNAEMKALKSCVQHTRLETVLMWWQNYSVAAAKCCESFKLYACVVGSAVIFKDQTNQ